ncbi:hypothetical protein C8Q75DRAFT_286896 [Abortiporus biennis]|nr:hypothetical protein C8Q75DRAFT_286896 [Abortiporus biennis]
MHEKLTNTAHYFHSSGRVDTNAGIGCLFRLFLQVLTLWSLDNQCLPQIMSEMSTEACSLRQGQIWLNKQILLTLHPALNPCIACIQSVQGKLNVKTRILSSNVLFSRNGLSLRDTYQGLLCLFELCVALRYRTDFRLVKQTSDSPSMFRCSKDHIQDCVFSPLTIDRDMLHTFTPDHLGSPTRDVASDQGHHDKVTRNNYHKAKGKLHF